jgi:hypothetical protein
MNKSLLTFGLLLTLGLAPNATAGKLDLRPLEILERFNQPTFERSGLQRSGLERSGLERSTFGQPALERSAQAAPNSWTILVYLHADHNLEGSSVTDLEEMEQVGSSAGFKIVYQWDRNETPGVVRGEVTKSPADGVQSRTVQKLPELNSDDPKVLADFVRWGIKTYPAQRYGLIMWDHGGQWQGFGGDEQNGQNEEASTMLPAELHDAIKAGLISTQLPKLEFLAFDTCLMGGAELLLQFADLSKLYIADPELDYGDGWNYEATFGFLKANPSVDMRTFGKREVADWQAQHSQEKSDLTRRAHAAYDTAQAGNLQLALKGFSGALKTAWTQDPDAVTDARAKSLEYSFDPDDPHAPRDFIDLGQFADLASGRSANAALKSAARTLNAAIASSIIAKSLGSKNKTASALSIYLPSDASDPPTAEMLEVYNRLAIKNAGWTGFVSDWLEGVEANAEAPSVEITDTKNTTGPTPTKPATVEYAVGGADVATLYGSVGRPVGNGKFNLYGDLYYQSGDEGDYTAQWDGQWIVITDSKRRDLFCGFYQDPDDETLYASAEYTPPGETESYLVAVVADEQNLEIISVLDDSGSSPREMEVEPGGKLAFQYLQFDEKTDDAILAATGTFVLIPKNGLDGLRLGMVKMPKDTYSMLVGAVDWAGNEDSLEVEVKIP